MSGGNLANRLLFENNTDSGVPMLFIVMLSIAGIILVLLLAIRAIEIMLVDEKHSKLKITLRNMTLLFVAIPTIPVIFYTLNIIVISGCLYLIRRLIMEYTISIMFLQVEHLKIVDILIICCVCFLRALWFTFSCWLRCFYSDELRSY